MKIDLDASVCLPRKCPPRLEVEPTGITLTATGKPRVLLTPLKVKLPHVRATLPTITATLPEPEAEAALYAIPWIEAPLATPGLDDLASILVEGDPFPMKGATRRVPAAKESAEANNVTGEPRDADGNSDALRYNSAGLAVCFEMRADLGVLTIDLGKFDLDLDNFQMHGMPEDPKSGIVASGVTVDLDSLTLRARTDKIDVKATGCVVLNGGDGCCGDDERERAPAHPAPKGINPDTYPKARVERRERES